MVYGAPGGSPGALVLYVPGAPWGDAWRCSGGAVQPFHLEEPLHAKTLRLGGSAALLVAAVVGLAGPAVAADEFIGLATT